MYGLATRLPYQHAATMRSSRRTTSALSATFCSWSVMAFTISGRVRWCDVGLAEVDGRERGKRTWESPVDGAKRAILIVDHGSRRAEANEMLAGVAALVRHESGGRAHVEFAHIGAFGADDRRRYRGVRRVGRDRDRGSPLHAESRSSRDRGHPADGHRGRCTSPWSAGHRDRSARTSPASRESCDRPGRRGRARRAGRKRKLRTMGGKRLRVARVAPSPSIPVALLAMALSSLCAPRLAAEFVQESRARGVDLGPLASERVHGVAIDEMGRGVVACGSGLYREVMADGQLAPAWKRIASGAFGRLRRGEDDQLYVASGNALRRVRRDGRLTPVLEHVFRHDPRFCSGREWSCARRRTRVSSAYRQLGAERALSSADERSPLRRCGYDAGFR